MENTHTRNNKPTFVALLFFAAMTVVGVTTAHAQDTVNPLVSTTGPNVLGSGHIQWNTTLQWDRLRYYGYSDYSHGFDGYGAKTGFRFGIGNRAELTLGVEAFHYNYKNWYYSGLDASVMDDHDLTSDNLSIAPSVGARLLLYEGKGWLPKITFNTSVALATVHGRTWTEDETLVQPTIGLSFRNDLGKGWMLDYALNYTWNNSYMTHSPATFSLFARWLATDRLLLSAGFSTSSWSEPFRGVFEARYLVSPDLQLTLQGGVSGGSSLGIWSGSLRTHALAGVSWMLK